ncbi:uncharacterized protein [Dysidea avara]
MNYGPENGNEHFRQVLADFLSRQYQSQVLADELYVTAGSTFGLSLLGDVLFEAGDVVYIEDPTYFLVFSVLETCKLSTKCVSTDEEGIIPSALEEAIVQHNATHATRPLTETKPYRGMIYLIPTFHNPTGKCLSPERCKQIIATARRHNLLIVCDDVYNLLYFTDKPPTRLYSYDIKTDPNYVGSVVSNCSFSKAFSPAVRLGWIEAPYKILKLVASSGIAVGSGCFNHMMSGFMASVISQGHLDDVIKEYRTLNELQSRAISDVFEKEMPKEVHFSQPMGGYYVWVTLPEGMNAQDVMDECFRKFKISFRPGNKFSASGNFKNCFRICFAFYNVDTLRFAAKKIISVIQNHL